MPEMTAEQAAEWGKSLSFEKVWAAFKETDRKFAEVAAQSKETDRKIAEVAAQSKETDRIVAEVAAQSKETDRKFSEFVTQSKETERKIAEFVTQSKETERIVAEFVAQSKETERIVAEVAAQSKGTDRKFAETTAQSKETDRIVAENAKHLDQLEKNLDKMGINVGGLNRSLGELIEILIAARLWEKFPQYNLKRSYQRLPIYDKNNKVRTDIDILLVNEVLCMAVEVKHRLNRKDEVDDHLKRMQLIREYPPEQIGNKELLGAMAGGVVDADVENYAHKCGFFVLELTGESVHLITPPEGFIPGRW